MIDRRRFFQLTAAIAAITAKLTDRELEEPELRKAISLNQRALERLAEPEEVELHTSGTPSASGFWAP